MAESSSSSAAPVLELAGARVRFDTDHPQPHSAPAAVCALDGVDLQVRRGEMVAVLGPQSSGTSTLCRLAAGLLSGRGEVTGRAERHGSCALLGDDPEAQITGMTTFVDDEIRLPVRLHGSTAPVDVDAALALFSMQHLSGRRIDALSGGERQLAALASLMTLSPALLVLDQPSLSLDPTARVLLLRALREFCAAGGAVLLAGHQHDELGAAADRVQFLRRGRLTPALSPRSLTAALLEEHGVWPTVPASERTADETVDGAADNAADGAPDGAAGGTACSTADDTEDGNTQRQERPQATGKAAPAERPSRHLLLQANGLGAVRSGTTVFTGVDLQVGPGETLAVVGPNGAGKSTLLRALARLLGRDAQVSGEIRAGLPAWVGQDPGAQLSASTALAELERAVPLPPHRRRDRARVRAARTQEARRLLERVGLGLCATEHPYDLGPAQRKDLVIASALLMHPDVLLLDEPTLGRDHGAMQRLENTLHSFRDCGGAVVVTTHDLIWAERTADRVLRMTSGFSESGREHADRLQQW